MSVMNCFGHPIWSVEVPSVTEGFPFSSLVASLPSSEGAVGSRCSGNLNAAATDAN